MASKQGRRGSAAPLPPVGPVVVTQATAASPFEIGYDWVIIAIRPTGRGIWEPTMPHADWKIVKDMMEDGSLSTSQRRDPEGTVLLARLKKDLT